MADNEVSLRMTLEMAQALQALDVIIRKEAGHDQAMNKTLGTSRKIVAIQKELAESAKSLDQIRAALAAGDERRLKTRLSLMEQEARADERIRASEARRLGALGQSRFDSYTARKQSEALAREASVARQAMILAGAERRVRRDSELTAIGEEIKSLPAIVKPTLGSVDMLRIGLGAAKKEAIGLAQSLGEGYMKVHSQVSGWVSIGALIHAAADATQIYQQRLDKLLGVTESLGEAQIGFVGKTAGESEASVRQALRILATGGQYATPTQMTQAATAAAAAYGGDPVKAAQSVIAADPLALGNVEQLGALAAGQLDLEKATGRKDSRFNLGFGLLVGKHVRTEDPIKESQNIAQALARSSVVGGPDLERGARGGAALYAYLTQVGVDVSGETGAQAFAVEAEQMRQFFRDRGLEDPGYSEERVRFFQKHPELAQQFLDEAKFGRERFKPAFEELFLHPESERVRKFYNVPLEELRAADPIAEYEDQVRRRSTMTPQIKDVATAMKAKSRTERVLARVTEEQLKARAKDIFDKTMVKTRGYRYDESVIGALAEPLAMSLYEGFGGTDEEAVSEYISTLERRKTLIRGYRGSVNRPIGELPERERTAVEDVQEQLRLLRDILQELRQQRAINKVSTAMALGLADRAAFMQ